MSVLRTEEMLAIQHSGGDCGLVPRKVALWGFCLSSAFAGELTWPGVNSMLSCFCERSLAVSLSTWFWGQWPEPCFLAVRVWDLGPLQGHSSEGHGSLSEGRGSRDGPSPLSSNPSPRSSTLCPPNPPLLPGHSLCKSGIFCWANGTSSLPFTHLATMGSCYGLEERGTDTCCLQVGPEHPAELAPEDPPQGDGCGIYLRISGHLAQCPVQAKWPKTFKNETVATTTALL